MHNYKCCHILLECPVMFYEYNIVFCKCNVLQSCYILLKTYKSNCSYHLMYYTMLSSYCGHFLLRSAVAELITVVPMYVCLLAPNLLASC